MLLGDCNSRGFGLGIPFMRCDLANWRNASRWRRWYCLASPRMNYVSGSDLGELPFDVETMMCAVPWFWLTCDEKGRCLPTWLWQITNCTIEASIEHPADRIRNGAGEKTGSQVGRVRGRLQASRVVWPEMWLLLRCSGEGWRMKSAGNAAEGRFTWHSRLDTRISRRAALVSRESRDGRKRQRMGATEDRPITAPLLDYRSR